jgi:glycoside/pentoside/hexuronide:cation symporter, GPH family
VTSRLNTGVKLSYGMGQLGWAAKDTCFQFFLFFYYTQMLGLSPSLAGLAALLALIADGISDPIIGHLSDTKRLSKWGRRHPFMIVAVVPFCISLIAIFNPPADLSQTGLFAWYLGMAIVIRTFLTLFTVPHMALGAELSEDYTERTSIAVYRNILGYLSGLSIQVVAWFLLIPIAVSAGNMIEGYRNIGYVGAVVAFIGMVAAIVGTRHEIPRLVMATREQCTRPWYYAFVHLGGLFRIQPARVLLIASLVIATSTGVSSTMLLHINTYLYGFSSEQIGVFMLCIVLALLPASWLAMKGTRLLGKPKAVITMLLVVALVGPIPVLSYLYGFAPAAGSTSLLIFVCGFIVVHQSFFIAHLNIVSAMVPDVVDEIEVVTGRRQEGVLNSAIMLTQKVTFGLGAFLAGLTIEFAGFDGVTNAEDVSVDMLTKLAWMYGPGLTCVIVLGVIVYSRYGVSQARYEEVRAQLALSQR